MLPDLDSLSLFVMAAETGSLTKAADASFLSLAAVSRRISLLEERFKIPLLERTARGVMPTDAGRALLAHAKRVLLEVNQLQREMADHSMGSRGALRLLASTSAVTSHLPRDLMHFHESHPGVRVSIGEAWSEEIVRAIVERTADVGIIVAGSEPPALEVRPYRSYRIAAVMPPDHPLARVASLEFVDVLPYEIVALESSSLMMRSLLEHAALVQRPLLLRVQVRSFEAVCRLVQSGLGVGLLPLEASEGLAGDMGLTTLPLADDWAQLDMLICFRKDGDKTRSLSALVDHLADRRRPSSSTSAAVPFVPITPPLSTTLDGD